MSQKHVTLELKEVHLWTQNPRDPVDENSSDEDIICRALEDPGKRWRLTQLIENMGEDYDFSELPTVVLKNGKYVAYDGNKRLAALKCIQNNELYNITTGKMFLSNVPEDLQNVTKVVCNLCDEETAIRHVRRKHYKRGDWKHLERDQFDHYIAGQEKSVFLKFEEATGLISLSSKMNAENVKSEILTEKNLNEMGFSFDGDCLVSMYDNETTDMVLRGIKAIVDDGLIKQGDKENRGKLKKVFAEQFKKESHVLTAFDEKSKNISRVTRSPKKGGSSKIPRRTPVSKPNDEIFGGKLVLRSGRTNDLYRAIEHIYRDYERSKTVNQFLLPIICMSLRLLLNIAAIEYYESLGEEASDDSYKKFLKLAKMELKQRPTGIHKNDLALLSPWFDGSSSTEGVLSKWAHGTASADESAVLLHSRIIAIILTRFFGRN